MSMTEGGRELTDRNFTARGLQLGGGRKVPLRTLETSFGLPHALKISIKGGVNSGVSQACVNQQPTLAKQAFSILTF